MRHFEGFTCFKNSVFLLSLDAFVSLSLCTSLVFSLISACSRLQRGSSCAPGRHLWVAHTGVPEMTGEILEKKKTRTTKHCDTVFFNSRNWNSRTFDEHVGYFRIHRGVCVCHLMAAGTKKPRRRKLGQTPAWVSKWDWGRYSETSWEFRNTNKWEILTKCEKNGKERGEARASFALNAAVRLRSVGFDQINQKKKEKKEKIICSYITSLVWIAVFCSPSRFDLGAASVLAFTGGRQIPSRRASNTPWSRSHVNKELRTWHCLWPALLQRWYVDPITTCKWPPPPPLCDPGVLCDTRVQT